MKTLHLVYDRLPTTFYDLVAQTQGRVVSFANTLLIMTSNVGSAVIAKGGGSLGFQLAGVDDEDGGAYSRISSLVKEELKARSRRTIAATMHPDSSTLMTLACSIVCIASLLLGLRLRCRFADAATDWLCPHPVTPVQGLSAAKHPVISHDTIVMQNAGLLPSGDAQSP